MKIELDKAYQEILGPMQGFRQAGRTESTNIALLAHDGEWDIGPLFKRYLPTLTDASNFREIYELLQSSGPTRFEIQSEIVEDPELEETYDQLGHAIETLASHHSEKPWAKVEQSLRKWFGERIATAIKSAVEFLANFIRDDRVKTLERPKTPTTTSSGPNTPEQPQSSEAKNKPDQKFSP